VGKQGDIGGGRSIERQKIILGQLGWPRLEVNQNFPVMGREEGGELIT
jgi:hypothetical protein